MSTGKSEELPIDAQRVAAQSADFTSQKNFRGFHEILGNAFAVSVLIAYRATSASAKPTGFSNTMAPAGDFSMTRLPRFDRFNVNS